MIKRYGAPSDALVLVRRDGVDVAFLARHGRDHALIPSQTPFRANIHALKSRGVLAGALADAQFAGIRPQPLTGRFP